MECLISAIENSLIGHIYGDASGSILALDRMMVRSAPSLILPTLPLRGHKAERCTRSIPLLRKASKKGSKALFPSLKHALKKSSARIKSSALALLCA
jgi:hypothetical protein